MCTTIQVAIIVPRGPATASLSLEVRSLDLWSHLASTARLYSKSAENDHFDWQGMNVLLVPSPSVECCATTGRHVVCPGAVSRVTFEQLR